MKSHTHVHTPQHQPPMHLPLILSLPLINMVVVVQLHPTLCSPMYCSTLGFPVLYISQSLLKLMSIELDDAIQTFHSLLSTFPPAFNLSHHQGLFQWIGSLHQVVIVLELQHQSFQWIFRVNFLYNWLVWFPCSPRDSQESSTAPQFKSIISSVLSLCDCPTLTSIHDYWKNHSQTTQTVVGKVISLVFKKIKSVTIPTFPHLFAMRWRDWMP